MLLAECSGGQEEEGGHGVEGEDAGQDVEDDEGHEAGRGGGRALGRGALLVPHPHRAQVSPLPPEPPVPRPRLCWRRLSLGQHILPHFCRGHIHNAI